MRTKKLGLDEAMRLAISNHRAGQLVQAEAVYRQVLDARPDHPDALHLLGVLLHQRGDSASATELIEKAVALGPGNARYWNNLGLAYAATGKLESAAERFRKAVDIAADYAEAHANLGDVLLRSGEVDAAVACYERALALNPGFAAAWSNLGNAMQRLGRADDAADAYRRAAELKPDHAAFQANLGTALQNLGCLSAAVCSYRRALELRPNSANVHTNLGNALRKLGELDEAAESHRRAIAISPDFAEAYCNLAAVLRDQGRLEDAAEHNRRALALKPDLADAHYNLGNVLRDLGKTEEAVPCYRRAIELRPRLGAAHLSLAGALKLLGNSIEAFKSGLLAVELDESPRTKSAFVQYVKTMAFVRADPLADRIRPIVLRAMSEPWGRPSDLSWIAASLIKLDPDTLGCIKRVGDAWPRRLDWDDLFGTTGLRAVVKDRLLYCLLENTPVCDVEIERFLATARRALLHSIVQGHGEEDFWPWGNEVLSFCCALSQQSFINEYVLPYVEDELSQAAALRDQASSVLSAGGLLSPWHVSILAAYFPLYSLAGAERLLDSNWPDSVESLLTQQIREPQEELRYRESIPDLTPVEDHTSRLVRSQYEENPYPRWVRCPPITDPLRVDPFFEKRVPGATVKAQDGDLDILVAGCGTGRHPIETARQYPNARVLAVDLSLTSLSYAKRKTVELGLTNIEYAHADILKLGMIERRFDLIESVGVLHHLADPMEGWRTLVAMLRPNALMRLGFYSELARQHVVAGRRYIAERGYGSSPADIRQCRQDIIELAQQDRMFRRLSTTRDFSSTSSCRDLLFHVQEHRFTLPQIAGALEELDLQFVGFALEPEVVRAYQLRFPDDQDMRGLDSWHVFEQEYPDTFVAMYQFWVQKNS